MNNLEELLGDALDVFQQVNATGDVHLRIVMVYADDDVVPEESNRLQKGVYRFEVQPERDRVLGEWIVSDSVIPFVVRARLVRGREWEFPSLMQWQDPMDFMETGVDSLIRIDHEGVSLRYITFRTLLEGPWHHISFLWKRGRDYTPLYRRYIGEDDDTDID